MTQQTRTWSDEEIRSADIVMLVDPELPTWQEMLWCAPITNDALNSVTMQIVDVAVDSRDTGQVRSARQRVGRIKGGGLP